MIDEFADLPATFRGTLHRPGDTGFDEAGWVFNARARDTPPAAIAECLDQDDVVALVRWSAAKDIPLVVRSGGHSADFRSPASSGLVLDLSRMREVEVDPQARLVRVQAGARLGDLDRATQRHGLVVPSGTNSNTGVAGLTLGGGVGHLMRRFGATVDNLLGCDVVTAEGELVRADADTNPDLFWALRGGSGNFGVVVRFDFRAHPLGSNVTSGQIMFPGSEAVDIMAALDGFLTEAPRELSLLATVTVAPPAPSVPDHLHGTTVLAVVVVHSGEASAAQAVVGSLRALGTPVLDDVTERSWVETNSLLDAVVPLGLRLSQRGGYISGLSRELAHTIVKNVDEAPANGLHLVNVYALGGAISEDFAEDSAAFSRADAAWLWESVALWDGPDDDVVNDAWSDGLHADLLPETLSNCYINLTQDLGPEWRRRVYGDESKYRRLTEAKRRWDPTNRFRHNKNIEPAAVDG